jgi:diaminopimelate epimerase
MIVFPFEKYHGLGNDFIIIDVRQNPEFSSQVINQVKDLCDRRFGIGADGVLLIYPHVEVDARIEIYNSDGSRPEMCGNGIRCVASFLASAKFPQEKKSVVSILTDAGLKKCEVFAGDKPEEFEVSVEMGVPSFRLADLPCMGTLSSDGYLQLQDFKTIPLSMGNPHAVIFVEKDPTNLAKQFGSQLENDVVFPKRCNIEFARQLGPRHFEVGVWERGCGITLACGTGACAVVAAAVQCGIVRSPGEVRVDLPGGSLFITVTDLIKPVIMRGPATHVFSGK